MLLIKRVVEKDKQGVRETYGFYDKLTSSKAQVSTSEVEALIKVESAEQLKPIDCGRGSIRDV